MGLEPEREQGAVELDLHPFRIQITPVVRIGLQVDATTGVHGILGRHIVAVVGIQGVRSRNPSLSVSRSCPV
jgi:hypothetical protein